MECRTYTNLSCRQGAEHSNVTPPGGGSLIPKTKNREGFYMSFSMIYVFLLIFRKINHQIIRSKLVFDRASLAGLYCKYYTLKVFYIIVIYMLQIFRTLFVFITCFFLVPLVNPVMYIFKVSTYVYCFDRCYHKGSGYSFDSSYRLDSYVRPGDWLFAGGGKADSLNGAVIKLTNI